MLIPFDDYPVHQSPLPLAHAGDSHPDFYDRFFFNGYREDLYFGVALGHYPNRGVIDAAFATVHGGVQRSVFASGRAPLDRTRTRIGPLTVEIVEPMRSSRITVDAPEHGIVADVHFEARTAALEEPRQTRWAANRIAMDVTRATQLGTWSGRVTTGGVDLDVEGLYGTKDRSWGVRGVGDPAPSAPVHAVPQLFFEWAPLNFPDVAFHHIAFEDAHGDAWAARGARLSVLGPGDAVTGDPAAVTEVGRVRCDVEWAPDLRRARAARLHWADEEIDLEPLLTFRMKGLGYLHPTYAHGRWHGDLVVDGEEAPVASLDDRQPQHLHVQQVVRARWGAREGLGVLEQLALGPHAPSGFTDLVGPSTR